MEIIDENTYRQIAEDMLKMAAKMGANEAEVGVSASMGLNVSVRMREVDTLEFNRDKSIGITVYIGKQKGSASTTEISQNSLRSTVEAAMRLARLTESDPFSGLADPQEMAWDYSALDLYHPWNIGVEEATHIATQCEESALNHDKRIVNSEGATLGTHQGYHVYGNSHGFLGHYPTTRHSLSCMVIAADVKGMERDYQFTTSRTPDSLVKAESIGEQAAERALSRLSSQKLSTRRVPVLFHATVANGLISHFIAAISGERLFRKSSFLLDSLHKQIFPDFIHIYERPHLLCALASAPFDCDGVLTRDKDIVLNGEVQSYILSAYSARKLNLPNTGNGGGTHNIFIEPGDLDYEDILKKMNRGLVVTELMGQGINLITGDYSRGVAGFWVENGQIQYPIHEVTVAGNLRDMFAGFVAVGKDVDRRTSIQTGSILIEEMMVAGS